MAWSDMESKEKGMLVGTVIIFAVIGYMVYHLFFAGASSEPVVAASTKPTPAISKPETPASDLALNPNSNVNAQPSAPTASSVAELPKRELTPEELELLQERRQVQAQYLDLVNQYQLMEMQNKVASSEASLVKTQLDTAKAQQDAAKLGILLPGAATQDPNDDAKQSLRGIALAYVGQKNGIWSAVLNLSGRYITVQVGSELPDHSLVGKIDGTGIVLYKDGERRNLNIPLVLDRNQEDEDSSDASSTNDNEGSDQNSNANGASDQGSSNQN